MDPGITQPQVVSGPNFTFFHGNPTGISSIEPESTHKLPELWNRNIESMGHARTKRWSNLLIERDCALRRLCSWMSLFEMCAVS